MANPGPQRSTMPASEDPPGVVRDRRAPLWVLLVNPGIGSQWGWISREGMLICSMNHCVNKPTLGDGWCVQQMYKSKVDYFQYLPVLGPGLFTKKHLQVNIRSVNGHSRTHSPVQIHQGVEERARWQEKARYMYPGAKDMSRRGVAKWVHSFIKKTFRLISCQQPWWWDRWREEGEEDFSLLLVCIVASFAQEKAQTARVANWAVLS